MKLRVGVPLALMLAVACASPAIAADPVAEYEFQNSYAASDQSGPEMGQVGTGTNSFATEQVGSCYTPVLAFPKGNGLGVDASQFLSSTHTWTVEMTVRLDHVSGYRKLIDSDITLGTVEDGLYVHDGKLDYFTGNTMPTDHEGDALLADGDYARITLTSEEVVVPAGDMSVMSGKLTGYVDGAEQFTTSPFTHSSMSLAQPIFFRDEDGGSEEDSAGAVSSIRFYDSTLSAAEIGNGGPAAPTCVPPPDTTAPNISLTKHPAKKSHKKRASFEFTSDDPDGTSFACSIDGASPKDCNSPFSVHVGKGKHSFVLRAGDASGNESAPVSFDWKVTKKKHKHHHHHHGHHG